MNELSAFERFYLKIKGNRWYWLFSIFCRISLAYAFLVAGIVKIIGERFASGLAVNHPMGAYLEALHHTGYYYTFIGIAQVLAAILLVIPRTVTLGSVLYFPIIVNIWLLSFAVRFEGSFVTSPLMVFANLYVLFWNYDRLRFILPLRKFSNLGIVQKPAKYSTKFPFLFFGGVVIIIGLTLSLAQYGYEAMPRNSISDCKKQFINSELESAGFDFCECIHENGKTLDTCLQQFNDAKQK
jgi:uncharacterized membrane protein YphA (DoxX/SURF4 family)